MSQGASPRSHLVELDQDHPGFRDRTYRQRRDTIAQIAHGYVEGHEVPAAPYTPEEDRVWREVLDVLLPLHADLAATPYLVAYKKLALPADRIPQLAEVNRDLRPGHGISMMPVAGLVSPAVFLTYLSRGIFLSTQYVRHHSKPFYTPEPDVIHELIGHASTFVDEGFVRLSRAFGDAMVAQPDDEARALKLIRAYWYTLEFGLVEEAGRPKAYGAGLLSSVGELQRSQQGPHRPLDLDEVGATPFDPTDYQSVYFVARSWDSLLEEVPQWLASL